MAARIETSSTMTQIPAPVPKSPATVSKSGFRSKLPVFRANTKAPSPPHSGRGKSSSLSSQTPTNFSRRTITYQTIYSIDRSCSTGRKHPAARAFTSEDPHIITKKPPGKRWITVEPAWVRWFTGSRGPQDTDREILERAEGDNASIRRSRISRERWALVAAVIFIVLLVQAVRGMHGGLEDLNHRVDELQEQLFRLGLL